MQGDQNYFLAGLLVNCLSKTYLKTMFELCVPSWIYGHSKQQNAFVYFIDLSSYAGSSFGWVNLQILNDWYIGNISALIFVDHHIVIVSF